MDRQQGEETHRITGPHQENLPSEEREETQGESGILIIHLMRHAPIEFGKDLPKVKDRHITPEGRKWAQNVISLGKNELALDPDCIVSSPLLRAKEPLRLLLDYSTNSRIYSLTIVSSENEKSVKRTCGYGSSTSLTAFC